LDRKNNYEEKGRFLPPSPLEDLPPKGGPVLFCFVGRKGELMELTVLGKNDDFEKYSEN
jgi:hypothetical protein